VPWQRICIQSANTQCNTHATHSQVLLIGGAIIATTWEENMGSAAGEGGSLAKQFHLAAMTIIKGEWINTNCLDCRYFEYCKVEQATDQPNTVNTNPPPPPTDERVALLGVMQALFEASMYTFVFLWTPALNPHTYVPATISGGPPGADPFFNGAAGDGNLLHRALLSAGGFDGGGGGGGGAAGQPHLPHGLVFAIFMTASMVGTALAGRLMASLRLEVVLQGVFWAGAALLLIPALYHTGLADHATPGDLFEGDMHVFEAARQHQHIHGAAAAAAAAAGAGLASPGALGATSPAPGWPPAAAGDGSSGGAAAAAAAAGDVAAQLDVGGRVQLLAFCGFEVRRLSEL
jgi:hypothetical protein